MLKHFELFHLRSKNIHIDHTYLIFLELVHADFQFTFTFCVFLINYNANNETEKPKQSIGIFRTSCDILEHLDSMFLVCKTTIC